MIVVKELKSNVNVYSGLFSHIMVLGPEGELSGEHDVEIPLDGDTYSKVSSAIESYIRSKLHDRIPPMTPQAARVAREAEGYLEHRLSGPPTPEEEQEIAKELRRMEQEGLGASIQPNAPTLPSPVSADPEQILRDVGFFDNSEVSTEFEYEDEDEDPGEEALEEDDGVGQF